MTTSVTKFKETEIGLIPEEWSVVELGEMIDFSNGKTSPERFDTGENPVYGANGIIGFSDETNSPKESIVVGRVGAYCGSIYFSDTESWVTDNAIKGNAKDNNSPRFLYYLLSTLGLNERAGGSGQPLINQSILNSIVVQKPKETEQKQIAEILSSLDDKIELNRKINANLERLAASLFKKWFVDIGDELPEGWRITELKNVLELNYGKALKAEDRTHGKIRVYGSSGVVGFNDKKLVDGPGIIVGRKGNVGSVFWSDDDFYAIDTTYYVKSKFPLTYCYYLLKNQTFVNGDSVVPGLNRDQAYHTEVLLPNIDVLEKFDAIASDLIKSIVIIDRETENLCLIRNSLLPRLMSGKLRINNKKI